MTRPALHRYVAAVLLALCTTATFAQEEDDSADYHVEVIVVAHTEPFAAGESFDLTDNLFSDASAGLSDDEEPADPGPRIGSFERLAAEDFELGETARRLGNASRFRVLGHFGWKQDADETSDAQAKGVISGDTDGRVNGSILLSRSRFLRLDVDLNFADGSQTLTLQQTRRRVQLGKPHYIDHPYFGLIVQVSRAPSPQ